MRFYEEKLAGVRIIEGDRHCDGRGYFQRTFDAKLFENSELETSFVQSAISFNHTKGTVRGLHWQEPPSDEAKLITCLQGGIFDVLVDMREGSPTRYQFMSVELWDCDGRMLYVPKGIAHGYQTLQDNTLVGYQLSAHYDAPRARRARWNDPAFGITWPLSLTVIADLDRDAPLTVSH
ncbi:MAG: dTDP-4-dehydrorhamnose 3,5-epimerase family protein [Myxococcaceae bacterium]|nr:dTDP-4-dehydrorhamnose 3,5-epimerase family protein [Myxococcaceae bacterium]